MVEPRASGLRATRPDGSCLQMRVAVVTGANKGIGLGVVRGLCKQFEGVVYLTARDEARGKVGDNCGCLVSLCRRRWRPWRRRASPLASS